MGSDPFQLAKQNVGEEEEEKTKMLHRGGGGEEGEVKTRLRGSNREKSCCIYGGK